MNRASWRVAESFSPPLAMRAAAWAGVSEVGTPSAKRRTVRRSRLPSSSVLLPTMSLVIMPWTLTLAVLIASAMWAEP